MIFWYSLFKRTKRKYRLHYRSFFSGTGYKEWSVYDSSGRLQGYIMNFRDEWAIRDMRL